MEEMQSQRDFSGVETSMILVEFPHALHMEHQVTTSDEFDNEEQARFVLEAGVQAHEERIVRGRLEDMFLGLNPINVLVIVNERFLDDFHSVNSLGRLQFHH